jgi:hypothetical protein
MKCRRRFEMRALTAVGCAHTRHTRSVQRGNGTLHAWVQFGAKLTLPCHNTPPTVSIPLGRWMKVQGKFKMQAHIISSVVVDIAAFKVSHSVRCDIDATTLRRDARHRSISSCNVQPNQLGRPARLYLKDPAPTLGIEHHTSRHLRLDGQGAVDADRRSGAHVAGELVCARCQQDLVDPAVR